jgi:hypothetical protein
MSLVPVLRPFWTQTCAEVKRLAFSYQTSCYLKPYIGVPSICELSVSDWWRIFWIVKDAFTTDFQDSLLAMYRVCNS